MTHLGASCHQQAKRIIKLINSVAAVVNADPDVAGRIKVVFIPDYNVSVAELVVTAQATSPSRSHWPARRPRVPAT